MDLSAIGAQKVAAIEDTANTINKILDYVATHPNDGIIYRARNMVLTGYAAVVLHN